MFGSRDNYKRTGLTKEQVKAVRRGEAEIERTCSRCSRVWYTSRPEGRGAIAAFDPAKVALGNTLGQRGTKRIEGLQRAELAARTQADLIEAHSCPECGSQAYVQRVVAVTP
jgi:hypothetical protein